MLASTAGWRYGVPVTRTPTRIRLVRLGQRGESQPTLETRPAAVGEDRFEVIEGPPRLEHVDLIRRLPAASMSSQVVVCGEVLKAKRIPPVSRPDNRG